MIPIPGTDMKIEVKEAHIDRGLRGVATADPLAYALTEQYPNNRQVYSTYDGFWVGVKSTDRLKSMEHKFYPWPEGVAEKVIHWDRFGRMKPFSFELDLTVTCNPPVNSDVLERYPYPDGKAA